MNRFELHALGAAAGDVPGNLAGMKAAVLDEPAAGLIAAAHRAGDVDARPGRFERRLVVDRRPEPIVLELEAEALEEAVIRVVAGRGEHPVVLDLLDAAWRFDQERSFADLLHRG